MINPVADLFGRMAQQMQPLQNISQMATGMANPQSAQQMVQNDPRIQQIMQMISQNGGDGKSLFYKMAQQKGADPNQIIYQAKMMMNNMPK